MSGLASSLMIINAGEGIGPHVTKVALRKLRLTSPQARRGIRPGMAIFSSDPAPQGFRSQASPEAALAGAMGGKISWWQHRSGAAAQSVIRAFELAHEGMVDAVVTGPIRKTSFHRLGIRELGHNGVLRELMGYKPIQGYVGSELNVVLASDHIPLAQVPQALTASNLQRALSAAEELRSGLEAKRRRLPIAWLGLNPHAGENGLMGREEARLARIIGRRAIGPLPADSAFTLSQRAKYSVVIALYHDQGLIPFKTLHGPNQGYQISLGLPFVRTSVDHGTADDLLKSDQLHRAEAGSMLAAILGAQLRIQAKAQFERIDGRAR
ncbi:MAG TPA: 4-hydroxythreonine-4-phosphate dehydrogenase PdxA [Pseudobdellovibrionaceae bacterium]|nr:4-hydroxythreonine-4-phosphate dehydrogenase PdxA [Pseudobdellovibrionaceae bacterium]